MEFELIAVSDLGERRIEAWRELAGSAVEPNPFFDPDFVLPATGLLDRDNAVGLAAVWDDGVMAAAMPVTAGLWRGRLPAVAGWRHRYVFLGTPLLSSESSELLKALLVGAMSASRRRNVVLEQINADGPVSGALDELLDSSGFQLTFETVAERAALRRRADGSYLEQLQSKRRRELARQRRRLDDELGGGLAPVDVSQDAEAVERFMEVEALSWKGEEGTALRSRPGDAEMFRQVCERFRSRGQLQLLELRTPDRVAAVQCNLISGEGLFSFKIGFDETLARFSPGVQLELDNIAIFHESDLAWMDSCAAPDNQMINRIWRDRLGIKSVVVSRAGLPATATRIALGAADRLRQRRQGVAT